MSLEVIPPAVQSEADSGFESPALRSLADWNAKQQKLYLDRDYALRCKQRLDQVIMTANPHSSEASAAIRDLAQAEKALRRADAAWRTFIRDRLKQDPAWTVPEN